MNLLSPCTKLAGNERVVLPKLKQDGGDCHLVGYHIVNDKMRNDTNN